MTPVIAADDVLGIVRRAVTTVLPVDPAAVTPEARFRADLKADSLALLEIVQILEDALAAHRPGFRIRDEDVAGLLTVGDAVDYTVARL